MVNLIFSSEGVVVEAHSPPVSGLFDDSDEEDLDSGNR